MPLFFIFIIVPIVEMALLIEVGQFIGVLPTIGLVLLTATIGVSLLKNQGFQLMQKTQEKLQQGQIPAAEVLSGIVLAIGGALLLTPGFVTDTFGFLCLMPFFREGVFKSQWFQAWLAKRGNFQSFSMGGRRHNSSQQGDIIEGEYESVDDKKIE